MRILPVSKLVAARNIVSSSAGISGISVSGTSWTGSECAVVVRSVSPCDGSGGSGDGDGGLGAGQSGAFGGAAGGAGCTARFMAATGPAGGPDAAARAETAVTVDAPGPSPLPFLCARAALAAASALLISASIT